MRGFLALKLAWGFTLFDIVFTIRYWHLESNPVVVALGQIAFVVLKFGLLVSLVLVWLFLIKTEVKWFVDLIIWLYAALMALVAMFNIMQILGFRF